MNFCTNCGKKIDQKNNFCTSCGKEIKKPNKTIKEDKPEFNVNNLILYVGVSLVILATFIFAVCTWNNMSGLFKISFLTFEALLFFIISFTFAKIKNNGLSKAFYLMAVMMIPVILYTIPAYSLLGDYLSYKGAGIFVYLAISNLICACIYLMSYLLLNTKAYTYITYAFIYAFINCIFLIFEKSLTFVMLASLVFILIVIIINFINRKENYFRKSLTRFTAILFSAFSTFMVYAINAEFYRSYVTSFGTLNIYLLLITILYFVNTFVFIYQNRKEFYTYFAPFVVVPILGSILISTIENGKVIFSAFAFGTLLLYGLFLIFRNKYLKYASKAVTYTVLYILLVSVFIGTQFDHGMYLVLGILGVVLLGFNIINRFTENFKWMSDILIPLSGSFIIFGFIYNFIEIPGIFLMLLFASAYLVTYMIFKAINKSINKVYFFYAIIALLIAFFMCTYGTEGIYILFLNVLLLIFFIYVSFMEKLSVINVCTFIVLSLSLLKIQLLIDVDIKIIISCIALISIAVGIILKNAKPVLSKFYLFFGEIISLLLALTVSTYSSYVVIALIGLLFVVNFISICLYNDYTVFRVIAEIVGLILIYSIVNALVEVTLFSSIITLFIQSTVLVILGLTGREKGGIIILLSAACLIPYYDCVANYSIGITNQLIVLPFIVYLFVITFFFKMKYETRMHIIIWPLIVLSTIAINTTTIGIIFALGLALAYIFIGIIKKYKYLVTFGIIYIFVIIVFELFKMFNNLALLIAVLVIGLSLIIYVVINEVYKSKKNK